MFEIVRVPSDAVEQTETMGTKQKFWYEDERFGLTLFKHSRHDAGEDWAEKVAEQICGLLEIPHARYELALWNGFRGVVTPRFTRESERLIPGNELLVEQDPGYPVHASSARLKVPQHTVSAVAKVLTDENVGIPESLARVPQISGAWDVFVGYLMLDALIGNSDRHHENWGLVESKFTAEAYAARCKSKLYDGASGAAPLGTVAAFQAAVRSTPVAARFWLEKLGSVPPSAFQSILAQVPAGRISAPAAELALRILTHNRSRLLDVGEKLQ